MTRRATRRRYEIIGVLDEVQDATADEITDLLRRPLGTLYPDLAILEREGRIIADWDGPGGNWPHTRRYRLPRPGGRDLAWHTITRHIGRSFMHDGEVELIDTVHAAECRRLPAGARCWFDHSPERSWWPAGLGTWRIRPIEWRTAVDDYMQSMEIETWDPQTKAWTEFTGLTIGELEAAAAGGSPK